MHRQPVIRVRLMAISLLCIRIHLRDYARTCARGVQQSKCARGVQQSKCARGVPTINNRRFIVFKFRDSPASSSALHLRASEKPYNQSARAQFLLFGDASSKLWQTNRLQTHLIRTGRVHHVDQDLGDLVLLGHGQHIA